MRLVWQVLAVAAISFLGGQGLAAAEGRPWLMLAGGVLTAIATVLIYRWVVGRTERRPATEVSRSGAVSGILWGGLLGGGLYTLVIVNIAFLEGYTVNGLGSPLGAVGLFGFMVGAAITEEVLYRGVLFRVIEGWLGTWITFIGTAVVFGGGHLLNPNANLWGAVCVTLAGGMLNAVYIATRKLWVPIGLHFAWNFAASGIFSTEVSGNNTPKGLLDSETSGHVLLTGGEFGPEGSLYSVTFYIITMVVFLWIARRRGNLVPIRRRAAKDDATATLSR